MTRKDGELVARLMAVNRSLETVNQNVSEVLRRVAQRHGAGGLNASDLRRVGHRLVSLAGDLTTLGVDTARWADELDEATDTEG